MFQLELGLAALQGKKLQIIFYLSKKQRTHGPCMLWWRYLFCRFQDHNLGSNASFNSATWAVVHAHVIESTSTELSGDSIERKKGTEGEFVENYFHDVGEPPSIGGWN